MNANEQMHAYIAGFGDQLRRARDIARAASIRPTDREIQNVLILGMGGSAFGGEIIKNYVEPKAKVPLLVRREYDVPAWVGPHTLIIASSYSGNTEETLSAVGQAHDQGAEIAAITSGGKMKALAVQHNWNVIEVPGGQPPRTATGLSVLQQLAILSGYKLIEDWENDIETAIAAVESFDDHDEAKALAARLAGNIPVIYCAQTFESVALRWKQQFAENSKHLSWYHLLPEMNHNELVGWKHPEELMNRLFVIWLRSDFDPERVEVRAKITQEWIEKYARQHAHVTAKGEGHLAQLIYLLHFGDWVSYYLCQENGEDPIEIAAIDHLKTELGKL